jgi:hypothetical protein
LIANHDLLDQAKLDLDPTLTRLTVLSGRIERDTVNRTQTTRLPFVLPKKVRAYYPIIASDLASMAGS